MEGCCDRPQVAVSSGPQLPPVEHTRPVARATAAISGQTELWLGQLCTQLSLERPSPDHRSAVWLIGSSPGSVGGSGEEALAAPNPLLTGPTGTGHLCGPEPYRGPAAAPLPPAGRFHHVSCCCCSGLDRGEPLSQELCRLCPPCGVSFCRALTNHSVPHSLLLDR